MRSEPSRVPAFVFSGFVLFVWATRIRNALGDDELSGREAAVAVGTSLFFSALAVAVAVAAWRRRHLRPALTVLAGLTIVYWPVRVVQIALADHSVGFVLVHAALGVVSVVLAGWAWTGRLGRARRAHAAGVLSGR